MGHIYVKIVNLKFYWVSLIGSPALTLTQCVTGLVPGAEPTRFLLTVERSKFSSGK